ncbi:hypothetical protein DIPPA_10697 [Diplonema papillatum]|nr:hypothetical protein DIPPA_10697 [Diplonema papillatum]
MSTATPCADKRPTTWEPLSKPITKRAASFGHTTTCLCGWVISRFSIPAASSLWH